MVKIRFWAVGIVISFFGLVAGPGIGAQPLEKKDTTIILINDLGVQLECTQALNDLYNFKFDKAEAQFRYLRYKYKWHPLPYFFMGMIEWWKIMPNTKNETYDKTFFAYMDSTILVAENLFKKHPAYKIEAAFFYRPPTDLKEGCTPMSFVKTGVRPLRPVKMPWITWR